MEKHLVSINGQIFEEENAKISVFDRGFLFGDSIYEVTISNDRRLLFFDEHLDRLFNSARLINLELQFDRTTLFEQARKLLQQFNQANAYLRIIITRGISDIGLYSEKELSQNIIMIVKNAPHYKEELYTKGIYLNLVERLRNDKESLDPNAKSGNYLNNILAIQEAKKLNAYDAIMENKHGEITEGTTFNIWLVKDEIVSTPHSDSGLLKGITRGKLIDFIKEKNIPFQEVKCTKNDFYNADEVFITSSTKGIMPVYQLNSRVYHDKLAPNSITKKLMNIYTESVNLHLNETPYTF